MVRYFGIDPGSSGGIACLDEQCELETIKMPDNEQTLWECLSQTIDPKNDYCVIEEVGGYMPGDVKESKSGSQYRLGVAPGSRMFTFGQSYGTLRMALVATGLVEGESWVAVRPNEWQRWLRRYLSEMDRTEQHNGTHTTTNTLTLLPRDRKGGESREAYKRRLKAVAESLFPAYRSRITLKTADAILISLYCKHRFESIEANKSRTLWG